ncbi:Sb-PDE family phosphodiesterase [Candidatus Latescibacterota bacterium]
MMKTVTRRRHLIISVLLSMVVLFMLSTTAFGQLNARRHIEIPDIPGYTTLKCDFHMHTVFSDGSVWPHIRVEEAWREGLDVIAIADHIEYQPKKKDVSTDLNRSYELAKPTADQLGIMLIRGTEITRGEPGGHHNAIFITDVTPLAVPDSVKSMQIAADQGAFIFWNHPGWKRPDRLGVWEPIQEKTYGMGLMHGVEVVNGRRYDPVAHGWCLEKKMTMLCNSDVHNPITFDYDILNDEHRPMTLVFVKSTTEKELKKALINRRTALFYSGKLVGEEKYIKPIFDASVDVLNPEIILEGNRAVTLQIANSCDISFELKADGQVEGISKPGNITLPAHKTVRCTIRRTSPESSGTKKLKLNYMVTNALVAPGEGLSVSLPVKVTFVPVAKK